MAKAWTAGIAVALTLGAAEAAAHPVSHPQIAEIYRGMETMLGQSTAFPSEEQQLHSVIVTLQPGEETSWHTHDVPLFFYVLEGALTVDYGAEGLRSYGTGSSGIEAIGVVHKGRNDGTGPMRVLVVYLLGDGKAASTPADAPAK